MVGSNGTMASRSRSQYQRIVRDLIDQGAGGVILGCTEIGLLLGPQDAEVPLFDTLRSTPRKRRDTA